jgi:L,D-transpeptidase-like protein
MKFIKLLTLSLILPIFIVFLFNFTRELQLSRTQNPIISSSLSGIFKISQKQAIFNNQEINIPKTLSMQRIEPKVLGETYNFGDLNDVKRIYIDLARQRLYAYEGKNKVFDFLVSTGKWGRTPTGVFNIWIKLRYTTMSGGSQALGTYYYLPNVPFVMFFYNDQIPQYIGYGIHGTYWHDNFGHPMSHGCINMRNEDVEKLYYWADPNLNNKPSINATDNNPGTEIIIYGKAPNE